MTKKLLSYSIEVHLLSTVCLTSTAFTRDNFASAGQNTKFQAHLWLCLPISPAAGEPCAW